MLEDKESKREENSRYDENILETRMQMAKC